MGPSNKTDVPSTGKSQEGMRETEPEGGGTNGNSAKKMFAKRNIILQIKGAEKILVLFRNRIELYPVLKVSSEVRLF